MFSPTPPTSARSDKRDGVDRTFPMTPSASTSQDIWSSILDSVASSRATPTKNVFLFGEPNVGKSTFLNFVQQENRIRDKPTGGLNNSGGLESAPATASEEEFFKRLDSRPTNSKLALTHAYVDLKDEESEDSMARINFYQLADPHPRFHKLVNMALGPTQYGQSAAMIFLDWGRPWLFLESMQKWLRFLELAHLNILDHGADPRMLNDADAYTAGKALMEELTTHLARYIQDYKDAPMNLGEDRRVTGAAPPSPINLPQGCLTRNLGIPLIIVCTKSDKIKQVEREGDYKENHFDFVQQTMRTICLQYGATLIYTSIHRPNSFALLRNYLLHRLFGAAGSSDVSQTGDAAPAPSVLPSYLNNFKTRGLMVERESVFVPSGWDSFNKIRVLRESFQCDAVQRGMHRDLATVLAPHVPPHHQSRIEVNIRDNAVVDEGEHESLNDFYTSIIPLPFSATRQAALSTPEVSAQPEQAFLAAHFAMFQGMDSASSYFPNPLPYVGTAADKSSRGAETDQQAGPNPPLSSNSTTSANSFFKMLAMKENAK